MFKKYEGSQELTHKISDILFKYRNIPHTTTGKTPAELFLKRTPRTILSLTKPCLQRRVERSQAAAKFYRDGSSPKQRAFDKYQRVLVRNIRGGKEKWIPGVIVEVKGPLTYLVRVPGNNRRFVHADHLVPDDRDSSDIPRDETKMGEGNIKFKPGVSEDVEGRPFEFPYSPEESSNVPFIMQPNVDVPIVPHDLDTPRQPHVPLVPLELPEPVSISSPIVQLPSPKSVSPSNIRSSRYGRVIKTPRRLDL